MTASERDPSDPLARVLADEGFRRAYLAQETDAERAERQEAALRLAGELRGEQARRRIAVLLPAAALLAAVLGLWRPWHSQSSGYEELLAAHGPAARAFPVDPFGADFDELLGAARTERGPGAGGPRVLAPLAAVDERRPEIRFDPGELPGDRAHAFAVTLLSASGRALEREVECPAGSRSCSLALDAELEPGAWVLTVALRSADGIPWSDSAPFEVRPEAGTAALLESVPATGDALLDLHRRAARLLDEGLAARAKALLGAPPADATPRIAARHLLLLAKASALLREEQEIDLFRGRWRSLRDLDQGR